MRICSAAYFLDLPDRADVLPVFHVTRLKELICSNSIVTMKHLVPHEDLSSKPHSLEKICDARTKILRSKQIQESKIKWLDQTMYDAK